MEREAGMENFREKIIFAEGASGGEGGPGGTAARGGPTWRALAVSIIVAVALSVMAMLMFGGSFGVNRKPAPARHAPGDACCPAPPDGARNNGKR